MNRTALLSVYNKTGIVEFAQALVQLDWTIYSSGGTAKVLTDAGVPVTDVAEMVGGEAILGHRVVTLSREVHAGLLAKPVDVDLAELESLGVPFIDLVCVDLYPLAEEIAKPDATPESVIEKTDIGGPTMLRSAAKGRRIVIADPGDRTIVLKSLALNPEFPAEARDELAAKAEFVVAKYCLDSARYTSDGGFDGVIGRGVLECKYGENGWQTPAVFFSSDKSDPLSLDQFDVVAGTAPSYNNLVEIGDRQVQTITHIAAGFERNFGDVPLIAIGSKHGNCCGAAVGDDPAEVIRQMLAGDLRAIHGGLVMTNFNLTADLAEILLSWEIGQAPRRLLDAISAPGFDDEAIEMLRRKGDKCRFLANPALGEVGEGLLDTAPRFRYIRGGFLRQPNYTYVLDFNDPAFVWPLVEPIEEDRRSAIMAWAIGSTSNSNTITLVRGGELIGNGVGQQDRVGAAELALKRAADAGHATFNQYGRCEEWHNDPAVVAYSDSFFPFPDGVEVLLKAGVYVVVATSGSVNDQKIVDAFRGRGDLKALLGWLPDSVGRGFGFH